MAFSCNALICCLVQNQGDHVVCSLLAGFLCLEGVLFISISVKPVEAGHDEVVPTNIVVPLFPPRPPNDNNKSTSVEHWWGFFHLTVVQWALLVCSCQALCRDIFLPGTKQKATMIDVKLQGSCPG